MREVKLRPVDVLKFEGGTLVVYRASVGFSEEFGRIYHLAVEQKDGAVWFQSDRDAFLVATDIESGTCLVHKGVHYYRQPCLDFCYAFAPADFPIPAPDRRGFQIAL